MLDTGSTFSLIRHELWKKIQRPKENLTPGGDQEFALANGVSKKALGKFHCVLSLQGDLWTHTLHVLADSDLAFPVILGLDFMQKTNMQIDFKNKLYGIRVQDRQAYHPFLNHDGLGSQWQSKSFEKPSVSLYYALPGKPASLDSLPPPLASIGSALAEPSSAVLPELEQLIAAWPSVCSEKLGQTSLVQHVIRVSDDTPLWCPTYPVSNQRKLIIKQHLQEMEADGIIEPSSSPWASPVVLAPKPNGTMRFCIDYRRLNKKTHFDAYPMPNVHDILESLGSATVFSSLDLR